MVGLQNNEVEYNKIAKSLAQKHNASNPKTNVFYHGVSGSRICVTTIEILIYDVFSVASCLWENHSSSDAWKEDQVGQLNLEEIKAKKGQSKG